MDVVFNGGEYSETLLDPGVDQHDASFLWRPDKLPSGFGWSVFARLQHDALLGRVDDGCVRGHPRRCQCLPNVELKPQWDVTKISGLSVSTVNVGLQAYLLC